MDKLSVARFLWEKREEWGKALDLNPGLILPKNRVFKSTVEVLFKAWVEDREEWFEFHNPKDEGVVTFGDYCQWRERNPLSTTEW